MEVNKPATQIIQVWLAWTTIDEYGHEGQLIGVFLWENNAKAAAAGRGWYGGAGHVREARAAIDDDRKVYVLADRIEQPVKLGVNLLITEEQEIENAKAKLTDREKELLGVK